MWRHWGRQRLSPLMRAIAVLLHGGLLVLLLLHIGLSIGLVVLLPLLLAVPGLLRGRAYTYAWASMLLAFYSAGFLAEAYMWPGNRLWWISLAGVAAVEFVALTLFVRFCAREREQTKFAVQTVTSDAAAPPSTLDPVD